MKHFCSFSEAMKAGIAMRPNQAFWRYFRNDINATCATGAALEAFIERPLTDEDITESGLRRIVLEAGIHIHHAYIKTEAVPPCGCAAPEGVLDFKTRTTETRPTIENLIVHLNNVHKWTREAIADWLEKEEEKLGYVTLIGGVVESTSSVSKYEVAGV